MDVGMCVDTRVMLTRLGLTDCIRGNGWSDAVIPEYRWEARCAPLVKVVLGGIVSQGFQERVQEEVSFRDAMGDPEMLFGIFDELTPVQAVHEEERAAMQEGQQRRGTG